MTRRLLPYWSALICVLVLLLAWLTLALLPASIWFDVRRVDFAHAKVGHSPMMVLDREIKLPFVAEWSISIRRWDGAWISFCGAAGGQPYRPDSKLPKDADLKWWTQNQCHPLPAGRYEVIAAWRIFAPWPIPDKHVSVTSNVFEVLP